MKTINSILDYVKCSYKPDYSKRDTYRVTIKNNFRQHTFSYTASNPELICLKYFLKALVNDGLYFEDIYDGDVSEAEYKQLERQNKAMYKLFYRREIEEICEL
jgi:hypothetical protein